MLSANPSIFPHPPCATGFSDGFTKSLSGNQGRSRSSTSRALAHVNRDYIEAAYMRTDLFERRRVLMQQWADYVAATA